MFRALLLFAAVLWTHIPAHAGFVTLNFYDLHLGDGVNADHVRDAFVQGTVRLFVGDSGQVSLAGASVQILDAGVGSWQTCIEDSTRATCPKLAHWLGFNVFEDSTLTQLNARAPFFFYQAEPELHLVFQAPISATGITFIDPSRSFVRFAECNGTSPSQCVEHIADVYFTSGYVALEAGSGVPEPATVLLLAIAVPMLRYRRVFRWP